MKNRTYYGAWISNTGKLIPVIKSYHHMEVAEEILGYKNRKKYTKWYSVYKIMYRLGYIRISFDTDTKYEVSYWPGTRLCRTQKEYIKYASFVDKEHIYQREYKQ